MPDYQKGKIYAVWDSDYKECYIGSTCEKLCQRMASHRGNYKKYLQGHTKAFHTLYRMFDKYGMDKCRIELIEDYPCSSKEDLFRQEGYNIKNTDCVNRNVSGRTPKERYEDKKDEILARQKTYREGNKDKIKQRMRLYYEANKEKIIEKAKEYKNKKQSQMTKTRNDG